MLSLSRILSKRLIHEALKMNVFTQKLNPITGQCDWVVQNQDYDFHQEVARSSFADMLHDTDRNKKYDQAIISAVAHMHARGKKANVLDIGTGTGLLSMMALRAGADSVVACEAFLPMSLCAEKIIELNGFAGRIRVIPKRSTELIFEEDLKSRANILVTEVFDTELIGEGALSTFKHAHEHLLESDCIVIPQSATVFAHIIESPFVLNWHNLKDVYDEDGECLLKVPDSIKDCPGAAAVHDIQLSQLPREFFNTIVSPQPVFQFDWSGKTPFVYERFTINTFKAERDGTAQAVFMWWELKMDVDNKIVLSCAPTWARSNLNCEINETPWRDHWMQAIYYLPKEIKARKCEELNLISCHDEFSVWFNLRKDLKMTDADYIRPFCHCNVHIAYPRTRIGQLNDGTRSKKFLSLLQRHVNKDSVVLVLSHGFYHALAVEKLGAKRVICVESNMLSRVLLKNFIQFNKLSRIEIVESVRDFHGLGDDKINLVFGEPYYTTNILPWDGILFAYLLGEFRFYCSDDVKVFPKKAVIRSVAVQFKDLHKIRAPLGECEGFSMKPFDDLIEVSSNISDDDVEAQPLWEYPSKALSQPQDIAILDLETLAATHGDATETHGTFKLEGSGKCNGIALWVDWVMDEDPKLVISTGPRVPIEVDREIEWNRHIRQGVHLMNNRGGSSPTEINYVFRFDYRFGNITFKFS